MKGRLESWIKFLKSKEGIIIVLLGLLFTTMIPLHYKTVEYKILYSEDGKVNVRYQDGMLSVRVEEIGYLYTDLNEIEKWSFDLFTKEEPKIIATFKGPFIRLKSMEEFSERELAMFWNSHLKKIKIISSYDKINFYTVLIE
ncbi:MAG: hypothetical protein Q4D77_06250 [Peptostreptococcaceae bacterium]|nr:hypothetical protein [Peptostreptococcaceae bacterium]